MTFNHLKMVRFHLGSPKTKENKMDMITRIQIEDALKTRELVDARVKEVALIIEDIQGDIDTFPSNKWNFESYTINLNVPREGMEHLKNVAVRVKFSISSDKRPVTVKFGDPQHDEDDYYGREDSNIIKYIEFPVDYLTTDHWQSEVEKKVAENKKWWANYRLEKALQHLKEQEDKILILKREINDLRKFEE